MDLSLKTESFTQGNQSWLGSAHGTDTARSVTLDTSAFTAGTHYPAGFFLSGLPIAKITATGKYGPYDDAAVDGRAVLAGFLFEAVKAPSVNTVDPNGALLMHGFVVESKLPIAVDAAGKADVKGSLIFV